MKKKVQSFRETLPTKQEILERSTSLAPVLGVYVLIDGEEIVYVGLSSDIMRRCFEHRRKGKYEGMGPKKFDRLAMLPCQTMGDAERLEYWMIQEHRPKYNVAMLEQKIPAWWTPLSTEEAEKIAEKL